MILLCSISCNDVNGSVVDCATDDDGDDGSFIWSSVIYRSVPYKIRIEAPNSEGGRYKVMMLRLNYSIYMM